MTKVIFINRFFYPDNSATSIILSELLLKFRSSDVRLNAIVLTGSAMHVPVPSAEVSALDNVKVVRFWQLPNPKRHILLSGLNFIIFYFCTLIWLILFTTKKCTVVAKSDPPMLSVPISIAFLIKRFRYISWQQDIFPETAYAATILKSSFLFHFFSYLRDLSVRFAEIIITPSTDMACYLLSRGISEEKSVVIENFSSKDIFVKPECKNYKHKANTCLIGYSGNLGVAHEIEMFFEFILRCKDMTEIKFQINGSGSGFTKLKKLCHENSLSNVTFNGYFAPDEINNVLNRFDFHIVTLNSSFANFVYPSKFYNGIKLKRPTIFIGPSNSKMAKTVKAQEIGVTLSDLSQLQDCVDYIKMFRKSTNFRDEVARNCSKANLHIGNTDLILQKWVKVLKLKMSHE